MKIIQTNLYTRIIIVIINKKKYCFNIDKKYYY